MEKEDLPAKYQKFTRELQIIFSDFLSDITRIRKEEDKRKLEEIRRR